MTRLSAENEVIAVLGKHGGATIPIPVDSIAGALGIRVVYQDLPQDISGLRYRDSDLEVIGVNATQSPLRQRFTIAHELGHWRLHQGNNVRVDREVRLNFRIDAVWDSEEIQANRFAAELLVPRRAFDRALLEEWAYVRPYDSNAKRLRLLSAWLHRYNYHSAHTALGGLAPVTRVKNLRGKYI
ncbi:MAG TPA: ImmA/IrrE family metallo-endopeptidase [Candidatus Dormibacteraeota bacterium]|nr:ImmA/IrrE family metallo-endopeptidase [Candidatus Dormibacteraeota bacterium]